MKWKLRWPWRRDWGDETDNELASMTQDELIRGIKFLSDKLQAENPGFPPELQTGLDREAMMDRSMAVLTRKGKLDFVVFFGLVEELQKRGIKP